MSRIDDAVSRIIRVKIRSGLFDASPGNGPAPRCVGDAFPGRSRAGARSGSQVARPSEERRRRAASQASRAGSSSSARAQTAFRCRPAAGRSPGRATIRRRPTIRTPTPCSQPCARSLGADRVDYSADGAGVDVARYSAVVMVAAENPYAEMKGDVLFPAPLRHSARYPEDLRGTRASERQGRPGRHRPLFGPAASGERPHQPLRCVRRRLAPRHRRAWV